jgi:predicted nucleotidyltransferase
MIYSKHLPDILRNSKLEEQLTKVCEANGIALMAIFGSFARGKQNSQSDVDLAIEFDKNSGKSLFDLVRLEFEFSRIFKRKVDLGTINSINPHVVKQVKKEMRVIYEKR